MGYIKDSSFYKDAIHELNYPCGNFYLFESFVIGEINEGVVYSWDDHAKEMAEEISHLYDYNGENIMYISNRVNSYSVKPLDWIKFFKNNYKLKGYSIVSYSQKGLLTSLVEKLFFKDNFQSFDNLEDAIAWAKWLAKEIDIDQEELENV
ncbi:hypothetical protein ABW636_04860 [Aquimarina sp. 2201CG1-2-11]|uniref:hypothetical protein n=1 Tax=Aquimarina discodermiae TaxID=3231043 RepID=UPI003462D408